MGPPNFRRKVCIRIYQFVPSTKHVEVRDPGRFGTDQTRSLMRVSLSRDSVNQPDAERERCRASR